MGQRSAARAASTDRILGAARALVREAGAAAVSMGDVAARAAVSKALVLYHFHDRETLLVALVESLGRDIVAREGAAIARPPGGDALDDYWRWLDRELAAGDIRVLVALSDSPGDRVRAAVQRVARERRERATVHVEAVFAQLGLVARMPPALLAETMTAFIDGLAVATAAEPDRDPRPAFDALWLALLTLSE